MRIAILTAGASLVLAIGPAQTTVIHGRILSAITRQSIAGAIVKADGDSTFTDATGAYTIRVGRATGWLGIRKEGWLDFQHPLLEVSTDTLYANIELRSDPPSQTSYVGNGFLPPLCVRMDDPSHLEVTHRCDWPTYPEAEYVRRTIKHNPWSPYFGRAGDRGGIMLATKMR